MYLNDLKYDVAFQFPEKADTNDINLVASNLKTNSDIDSFYSDSIRVLDKFNVKYIQITRKD